MIIIDLEWNRSYDKIALEEILQIGAVRLEKLGGPIVDTFTAFIRPRVHKRLNRTAKSLPELHASLDSQMDFPEALMAFWKWCNGDRVFADWGGDDFDILRQNCAYWRLSCPKPARLINLQAAFSLRLGTSQGVALYRAVEYCGIPDVFTFHNALNDAMYTALLTGWIPQETLALLDMPKEIRRLTATPAFPLQPRRRIGPAVSQQAILNGRLVRRQTCPVCGETSWIRGWYAAGGGRYFAVFRCSDHGHFLCRLTLTAMEDGQWQGCLAVPKITPNLLQEFSSALQGGVIPCKEHKTRKRRRHHSSHRDAPRQAP